MVKGVETEEGGIKIAVEKLWKRIGIEARIEDSRR